MPVWSAYFQPVSDRPGKSEGGREGDFGSDLSLWHWNLQNRRFTCDPRWRDRLAGATAEEGSGREGWDARILAEDRPLLDDALNKVLVRREALYEVEYRTRNVQGAERWILERGWVISRDPENRPVELAGLHFDITRRREEQERASRSYQTQAVLNELIGLSLEHCRLDELLAKVIERLSTVMWLTLDPAGAVFLFDETGLTLHRVAALGLPQPQCAQCTKVEAGQCLCGRAVLTDRPLIADSEAARRPGDPQDLPRHLHYSLPLVNSENRIIGVLTLFGQAGHAPDVNETALLVNVAQIVVGIVQRAQAEEAEMRGREAVAANDAKSEFVANLSHEIRTPLNGIIGMTDCLLAGTLPAEGRESAEVIRNSADVLLMLINGVLDISKLEAGRMQLEERVFDLERLLVERESMFRFQAGLKNLTFAWSVEPGVPSCLRGDSVRLSQVIMNLVTNAIKFTAEGGVKLRVKRAGEEPGRTRLCFEVEDSGIGIPADRIPALFQRYVQGSAATARQYGGTGLGLAISKKIVELMDGRIEVESVEGTGSTFRFWVSLGLPAPGEIRACAESRATAARSAPAGNRRQARILAAEDNPTNQRVIQRMLEKLGHSLTLVGNGLEAVQALESGEYELILMDLQMPVMDGLTAAETIRADYFAPRKRGIPIVAMTARAFAGDREKCLGAGMSDYLPKPIRLDELETVLARCLDPARTEAATAPSDPALAEADPADLEVFAREAALARMRGDAELLDEIVGVFLGDAPGQLRGISAALDAGDAALVRERAHAIKGAAANAGAALMQAVAAEMQDAGERGDLEGARGLFTSLTGEYERYAQVLRDRAITAG